MLSNTLDLNVDINNDGNTEVQQFRRFEEFKDRSVYIGPGHSSRMRNVLAFSRIAEKPSGMSLGVAKRQLKVTQTMVVPTTDGTVTSLADNIATISFNLPVGTDAESKKELRQLLVAALDDDQLMDNFMGLGEI